MSGTPYIASPFYRVERNRISPFGENTTSNFSSADAAIEIGSPGGQHVLATFDLSRLR
jgi:hypothetical protein